MTVATATDEAPRRLPVSAAERCALEGFLREVRAGRPSDNTQGCLDASRAALMLQRFADRQG